MLDLFSKNPEAPYLCSKEEQECNGGLGGTESKTPPSKGGIREDYVLRSEFIVYHKLVHINFHFDRHLLRKRMGISNVIGRSSTT